MALLLENQSTKVTVKIGSRKQDFVLDDLDMFELQNIRLALEYHADAVRECILAGLRLWECSKIWEELREINEQLDKIANFLAIREPMFLIS